jgi:hypothetical protein
MNVSRERLNEQPWARPAPQRPVLPEMPFPDRRETMRGSKSGVTLEA